MKNWYIYQENGKHVGPVSTDLLVKGVVAGKVSRDAHVGAMGEGEWRSVLTLPEVAAGVAEAEAQSTPPPTPPLNTVPPAPTPLPSDTGVQLRSEDLIASAPLGPKVSAQPQPPKRASNPRQQAVSDPQMQAAHAAPAPTPAPGAVPTALKMLGAPHPSAGGVPVAPVTTPMVEPPLAAGALFGGAAAQVAVPVAAPVDVPQAPPAAPTPPAGGGEEKKKEEEKKPPVDPKVAMILPAAIFAVFALIAAGIFVFAMITQPGGEPAKKPDAKHQQAAKAEKKK